MNAHENEKWSVLNITEVENFGSDRSEAIEHRVSNSKVLEGLSSLHHKVVNLFSRLDNLQTF